ncbi:MAG: helix-turn-helix transcriptional regulator [Proteobacteria bacterium]|nr:helix-turn-helix transcriptional regulator [Pseudomonadota bacterium]
MCASVTVEELNRLTTQVYAACLDWHRWSDLLTSVHGLSGGARCALFGFDMQTGTPFNVLHTNFAPEYADSYFEYYGGICPWPAALGLVPVGATMSAGSLVPDPVLRQSEFYNDWVRPQDDIACGGGVTLARDTDRVVVFTGNIRRKDADQLEKDFLRLIGLLTPHLQQALDIGRLLAGRSFEDAAKAEVDSGAALLVLSASGRIIFANRQAEALIESGTIVGRDLRGRILLPAILHRAVTQSLAELSGEKMPAPRSALLTDAHSRDWQVKIAALDPRGQDHSPFGVLCGFAGRCLLLTLASRTFDPEFGKRLVQELALTEAEAAVALAMCEGLSLTEIADARRVSIHTIRNQVKSALSKTGSRRQVDLVRLVERLRRGGGFGK